MLMSFIFTVEECAEYKANSCTVAEESFGGALVNVFNIISHIFQLWNKQ